MPCPSTGLRAREPRHAIPKTNKQWISASSVLLFFHICGDKHPRETREPKLVFYCANIHSGRGSLMKLSVTILLYLKCLTHII